MVENIHYFKVAVAGSGGRGELAVVERQRNGTFSQSGKLGHSCTKITKSRLYDSRVRFVIVH